MKVLETSIRISITHYKKIKEHLNVLKAVKDIVNIMLLSKMKENVIIIRGLSHQSIENVIVKIQKICN